MAVWGVGEIPTSGAGCPALPPPLLLPAKATLLLLIVVGFSVAQRHKKQDPQKRITK